MAELAESERTLEVDHQSAVDHLNLVLNALRHQEKSRAIKKILQNLPSV